jgi:uncharacterized protein (DUF433 family)
MPTLPAFNTLTVHVEYGRECQWQVDQIIGRCKRSTIIWEAAMTEAGAVRWAARARRAYPEGVAYERITIDPNRMSGLPCIRDTRVTVSAVLGQLAAGLTIPELLADFPYLERADVLAALEFAAAAVQERELPLAHSA